MPGKTLGEKKSMKKIACIEGLRTIGWIGVFLCHFKGAFFPQAQWITDLTPLRFIYSGNAYVRLLFVISGFVLSLKYFRKECYGEALLDPVRRYFRLMPVVLVSEIAVYMMMRFGLLKNAEAAVLLGSEGFLGIFNQFQPSFMGCIKEALVTTYFNGANGYIGPLWTMVYEYLGAMLVLSANCVFRKSAWRWLFYLIMFSCFSGYYNYFILGMMISDLYCNSNLEEFVSKSRVLRAGMIIAGYYLLSMVDLNDGIKLTRVFFGMGITMFLLGLLYSPAAEKVLGNRVMTAGGKIAYSAYVIHWPLIESFSCGLLLAGYPQFGGTEWSKWVIFILTLILVVLTSTLLFVVVEQRGKRIGDQIMMIYNKRLGIQKQKG